MGMSILERVMRARSENCCARAFGQVGLAGSERGWARRLSDGPDLRALGALAVVGRAKVRRWRAIK